MELEEGVLVSPAAEVPVIEDEIVTAIRALASRGVGSKTIAQAIGVARNTVRRYLRQSIAAGAQVRPAARRLADDARTTVRELYTGTGRWQCGRREAIAGRARRGRERAHDSARGGRSATSAVGRGPRDGARRNRPR